MKKIVMTLVALMAVTFSFAETKSDRTEKDFDMSCDMRRLSVLLDLDEWQMEAVEAIQTCFSKYATFEGRARRSEYWFYTLFIWAVQMILYILGIIILGKSPEDGTNILMSIFSLATLVPSLAVFWRRMHDIGKSGAWFFLNLVPCVGSIVLLVFELTDSQPGENQFGMSPKYPVI